MTAQEQFLLLLEDTAPPAEALISAYLDSADALILGYLGESALPEAPQMELIRARIALALYNRRGAEGESMRTEGEVASRFEPMDGLLRLYLRPFLKARAVSLLFKAGEG